MLGRIICTSLLIMSNLNLSWGQELRVGFCHASDFVNIEYQTAIRKSINRFMGTLDPNFRNDIRFIECQEIPSSTFYGSPDAVYGREEAMAMMVEASYWSAGVLTIQSKRTLGSEVLLSSCCQLDWIDAYRLAKAKLYFHYDQLETLQNKVQSYLGFSNSEMDQLVKLVEEIHYTENDFWEGDKPHSDLFATAAPIYRVTIDNLVSFVIGHELFHFNDNSQMITTPSEMEESGLFNTFYSLQQYKRLLDPFIVNSDKNEINADKSGFRFLQLVDSNTRRKVSSSSLQTAIRKSTIDLLAFPVLSGFDLTMLSYDQPVETSYISGYLYPMIRMMMITAVLRSNERENEWAVKMCGNTSRAIVQLIQIYASAYEKSDGDVPDEVLELLPAGVTVGWETNYWDENSFSCQPN
ncbi:hypothetical protein BGP76_17710 [Reichenbachiella sp. MSK19-1]|nr:hypothetical protein BGP76_17710 [Reichenbachiella sp. MSK19-1]